MPATRSTTNNTDGLAFEAVAVTLEVAKGVRKTIVRDARGSVGKHGLLAILGPSGAGKTTLLAALARERPCDAGSKIWRPAGTANFLPQDDRLLPFLTVLAPAGCWWGRCWWALAAPPVLLCADALALHRCHPWVRIGPPFSVGGSRPVPGLSRGIPNS